MASGTDLVPADKDLVPVATTAISMAVLLRLALAAVAVVAAADSQIPVRSAKDWLMVTTHRSKPVMQCGQLQRRCRAWAAGPPELRVVPRALRAEVVVRANGPLV
jgi:hypothetical protein